MGKRKICKIVFAYTGNFLCVAFMNCRNCVVYKKQPEVSNTTKKKQKNGSWNKCSENTERVVTRS